MLKRFFFLLLVKILTAFREFPEKAQELLNLTPILFYVITLHIGLQKEKKPEVCVVTWFNLATG